MFSQQTRALIEADVQGTLPVEVHHDKLGSRTEHSNSEVYPSKGCYNSLSPPNRIPPEILSSIFLHVLYALRQRLGQLSEKGGMEWVRVTHVCQHWRQVALECRELWAHLSFASPEFTEIMLERSKNAPLIVESLTDGGPDMLDILRRTLSQTERLKVINLAGRACGDNQDEFDRILSEWSPTPFLETLALQAPFDFSYVPLPAALACGVSGAPNLKCLKISNLVIPSWKSLPLACSLTTLTLRPPDALYSPTNSGLPAWNEMLKSFASMPSLEDLTLSSYLPLGDLPSPPPPPLQLGNIQSVWIDDSPATLVNLFKAIHIPNVSSLELALPWLRGPDPTHWHQLISNVMQSCDSRARPVLQTLKISEDDGPEVQWTLGSSPAWLGPSSLDAALRSWGRDASTADILPALQAQADFSSLSKLVVSQHCCLTHDHWMKTFASLPRLSTIRFEFCLLPEGFMTTLAVEPPPSATQATGGDPAESPHYTYPSLARLELSDTLFGAFSMALLVSALNTRVLNTSQIPDVEIDVREYYCGFTRGMERQLLNVLPANKVTVRCVYHEDA